MPRAAHPMRCGQCWSLLYWTVHHHDGTWSQPTATVLACFSREPFRVPAICHRLPLIATTRLHKCSILCCRVWRRGAESGDVAVRELAMVRLPQALLASRGQAL